MLQSQTLLIGLRTVLRHVLTTSRACYRFSLTANQIARSLRLVLRILYRRVKCELCMHSSSLLWTKNFLLPIWNDGYINVRNIRWISRGPFIFKVTLCNFQKENSLFMQMVIILNLITFQLLFHLLITLSHMYSSLSRTLFYDVIQYSARRYEEL